MLKEFQEFISKGNVMDLAVGVIIGGAFGLIVTSLVGDIIMPIVGAIFGGFDFSNYFLPLSSTVTATSLEEARKQGAVFAYGHFLTVLINFLILAWIIFLMVRAVNSLRRRLEKEKPPPPPPRPPPTSSSSRRSAICWQGSRPSGLPVPECPRADERRHIRNRSAIVMRPTHPARPIRRAEAARSLAIPPNARGTTA